MEPTPQAEPPIQKFTDTSRLFCVTKTSKYLAMALFIILPFVGAYLGYVNAPEQVVEVEQFTIQNPVLNVEQLKIDDNLVVDEITLWKTYEDEELNFSISYPPEWKIGEPDGGLGISSIVVLQSPDWKIVPNSDGVSGSLVSVGLVTLGLNTCEGIDSDPRPEVTIVRNVGSKDGAESMVQNERSVCIIKDTQKLQIFAQSSQESEAALLDAILDTITVN